MIQSDYKTIENTQKIYPSHAKVVVYKQSFRVPIGEKEQKTKKEKNTEMLTDQMKQILINRSLKRTKEVIKDIILCNNFDYFCTFTFKDHRNDVDVCKARMHYWLQSQQKKYGNFDYLIVPEYHEDGVSIHFHALFNDYAGRLSPAINPKTQEPVVGRNDKQVYNLSGWASGFSTAIEITNTSDDRAKVSNYVSKYITKEMPLFSGKKRYWCSKGLVRPIKSNNVDLQPYLVDENVEVFDTEDYTVYVVKKG
ncbi:MAG: hypothetical protein WAZ21_02535 [Candidatus Saccharimonadales bacterium]